MLFAQVALSCILFCLKCFISCFDHILDTHLPACDFMKDYKETFGHSCIPTWWSDFQFISLRGSVLGSGADFGIVLLDCLWLNLLTDLNWFPIWLQPGWVMLPSYSGEHCWHGHRNMFSGYRVTHLFSIHHRNVQRKYRIIFNFWCNIIGIMIGCWNSLSGAKWIRRFFIAVRTTRRPLDPSAHILVMRSVWREELRM